MYYNSVVDFRLEQLESQNIAYEVEIEPYTVVTEEVEQMYPLTDYERKTIESVVMAESSGEPLLTQMAVAQTILCRAVLWDMNIVDVCRQPNQFATYDGEVNESCRLAVSNVFDLGYKPIDENVTHFYDDSITAPYWADNKESRGSFGSMRFYE
jgi:spore germination cell wall hydrolase CwlJ-like protein